jgi:hypothetical protein
MKWNSVNGRIGNEKKHRQAASGKALSRKCGNCAAKKTSDRNATMNRSLASITNPPPKR